MVEVRAFDAADAAAIELQDAQVAEMLSLPGWRERLSRAPDAGPCWSLLLGGRLIGCGGLVEQWPGRAAAWCVIGRDIPRLAWPAIHRVARTRIEQAPSLGWRRVEAHVVVGFRPGMRWVELLGMEREGTARGFMPDGADAWLYARVFA